MLAMADRDGYVAASIPGLAVLARVPIESVVIAMESFISPDEWSRTKDHQGRRIEERDGGWVLLNYEKYRTTDDMEHVRQKSAERTRRYRDKRKRHGDATVTPVTQNHPIAAPAPAPAPTTASPQDQNFPPAPNPNGAAMLAGCTVDLWPLTAAAIRDRFPIADDLLVHRIVTESLRAFLGVEKRDLETLTDEVLAGAVETSHQQKQRSAGLYLTTVPEYLRRAAVDRGETDVQ